MINVTCIIPSPCSRESYPVLSKCIHSLRKSANKAGINLKITIVSNGQNIVLKNLKKEIRQLIRIHEPYSFSKMNNVAIDYVLQKDDSNWVMLLNDDAFVDINFFTNFSKLLSTNSNCEVIAPLIYENDSGLVDSFGIEYFNSGYAKNSTHLNIKTQLATAACILISKNLLKKLKANYGFYFNEILGSYMEDVDFSLRIRALGTKIHKTNRLVVHHMVSFTNKRKSKYVIYQTYRNIIWLIIIDWPGRNIIKNLPNIILVQLWVFLYSTITKGPFIYLKIWIDTFSNLPKLLKFRKIILNSYIKNFKFEDTLSGYAFRTYHGYKIRLGKH